jgi:hypothetical protein
MIDDSSSFGESRSRRSRGRKLLHANDGRPRRLAPATQYYWSQKANDVYRRQSAVFSMGVVLLVALRFSIWQGITVNIRMVNEYPQSDQPLPVHSVSTQKNSVTGASFDRNATSLPSVSFNLSTTVVNLDVFPQNNTGNTAPTGQQSAASHQPEVPTVLEINRTTELSMGSRQMNMPIFYNVFIPDDTATGSEGTERAFRIVSDQLQQIAESYAGGHFRKGDSSINVTLLPTVHIYYTTVGPTDLLPESRMSTADFCGAYPHFRCSHLGHRTSGFESITLDHMHQYCRDHQSERVLYLHSKGSYHPSVLNDNWRRVLTMASTAKECIEPPDDKCNVCGALFYTQFTTFIPGNMFTATCAYVSNLLAPLVEFPLKHKEAIGAALLLRTRRQVMTNLMSDRSDLFGLERYNAEHWIGKSLVSLHA